MKKLDLGFDESIPAKLKLELNMLEARGIGGITNQRAVKIRSIYEVSGKEELTLNQILIGVFRKYDLILTRASAQSAVDYMIRGGVIRRSSKGVFKICDETSR